MNKKDDHKDFEQQLKALEDIVASMEKGDLSLEESLKAYENGVRIARDCQTTLDKAQQRIDMLVQRDGEMVEEPFDRDS